MRSPTSGTGSRLFSVSLLTLQSRRHVTVLSERADPRIGNSTAHRHGVSATGRDKRGRGIPRHGDSGSQHQLDGPGDDGGIRVKRTLYVHSTDDSPSVTKRNKLGWISREFCRGKEASLRW